MTMNERLILFGLHQLAGVGPQTIRRLMAYKDSLEALFPFNPLELEQLGLKSEQAVMISKQLTPGWIESRIEDYTRRQIDFVTLFDENYPELLRESPMPPCVLYTIGDSALLHRSSIAMVGTRVPTAYGKKVAESLSQDLCKAGFAIVSGLARGIDSCCHEGALRADGKTAAVLGTAIDVIYPPENRSLYEEISERGLIVSEYPIGTKSHPGLFPMRNRIIAGLALGTVVVEADVRSGSLITADAALEASREVFAVPGQITSPKSHGALNLIKQGAKLVMSAGDIAEEFQPSLLTLCHSFKQEPDLVVERTAEEERIYRLIEAEPLTFDQILEKSESNFGHLHSVLLSLLIKKMITQLPGSIYTII